MQNHTIDVSIIDKLAAHQPAGAAISRIRPTRHRQSLLLSQRLEHLRRLSNTIQALENVVAQCGDERVLDSIRLYAENQLEVLRKTLKEQIHYH